jgi:hypothetical protein
MALFSDEDDEFEKASKMKYIEECCAAARVVIDEASSDQVLFDLITTWNEPKIVSYEMTILARNNMLKEEDE